MRRSSSSESAPPQGRRIAIVLLILLLIALPLYLWPLRGSGTGLPGAASHSGLPRDPRDASAVAHIRADVWDGLMDDGRSGPKGKDGRRPGNLTRIAQLEDGPAAGSVDAGSSGVSSLWPRDSLSRSFGALDSGDKGDGSGGGAGDTPSSPTQFLAGPAGNQGSGGGSGGGWNGGHSGGAGNFGPFGGGGGGGGGGGAGGSGGDGPFLVGDPGDPSAPAPTPEPMTILLVGSNLALLGAAAWRRLNPK